MNLFHIKLTNGDEIISQTQPSRDNEKYVLLNPLELQDVIDKDTGVTAVILQDYAPFTISKSSIELNKAQVISLSKVEGEMIEYYKASLEFVMLFAAREANEKIKHATTHLNKYINQQVRQSISTDSTMDMMEEIFEEDLDDDTLDSLTSSNTTFH